MQKVFLLEDLRDETHVFAYRDALAIGGGDPCTLLPPMLEGIKSKKCDSGNVFMRGINPKDAAGLVEALQKALLNA